MFASGLRMPMLASLVVLLGPTMARADAPEAEAAGPEVGEPPAAVATPEPEAAPTPPPSEAELAEARHAFEVAAAAFENGDYETSATEFRTAYELSRHPALLYNIYLAEERAGRPGEAATMLERYLESDAPSAEERTVLERRLERLRTRVASREPVVDPSEDHADRAALIARPTDADGAQWVVPPRVTGPSLTGVAVLVTGAALLAGFAVLATLSEVEDQALASSCGRSAGSYCTASQTSGLLALNIAADVSWIAGAVAAGVGLVLLFALPPETEGGVAQSVAFVPLLSREVVGLAVLGSF